MTFARKKEREREREGEEERKRKKDEKDLTLKAGHHFPGILVKHWCI